MRRIHVISDVKKMDSKHINIEEWRFLKQEEEEDTLLNEKENLQLQELWNVIVIKWPIQNRIPI